MATDPREAASAKIAELIALLKNHQGPATAGVVEEAEALARAVSAFHMEGIRFRMFNVDRALSRSSAEVPSETARLLDEVRGHLEAAGFHTRSHQAPG
jgi:hypothetical protein